MRRTKRTAVILGGVTFFLAGVLVLALYLKRTAVNDAQNAGFMYSNDEYGFEFHLPAGWILHEFSSVPGQIAFFNRSGSPKEAFPGIRVTGDSLEKDKNSASSLGWRIIREYESSLGAQVVEPLSEIAVGNLRGLRFTADIPDLIYGSPVRMQQYIFEKKGRAVSVSYSDRTADFEKDSDAILNAVGTFKFIEGFLDMQTVLTTVRPNFLPPNLEVYNKWWKGEAIKAFSNVETFKCLNVSINASGSTTSYTRTKFLSPRNFEVVSWQSGNLLDIWRVVRGQAYYNRDGLWFKAGGEETTAQDGRKVKEPQGEETFSAFSPARYIDTLKSEVPTAIDSSHSDYVILQFNRKAPLEQGGPLTDVEQQLWVAKTDNIVRIERVRGTSENTGETQAFFIGYAASFEIPEPKVQGEEN